MILGQNHIAEGNDCYEFAESSHKFAAHYCTSSDLRFAPATFPRGEGFGAVYNNFPYKQTFSLLYDKGLPRVQPLLCMD